MLRKLKRALPRLMLMGLATGLLFEGSLRVLLFADVQWVRNVSEGLRDPGHFADRWSDEWWALHHTFYTTKRHPPRFDAKLGWLAQIIEPDTYAHDDEVTIGARRPILLYGDSFAACVTGPDDCWQGLLERSDLASDYALINYGTGGYGVDQIYLLMRESIERFAHLNPIVVIGILVDDDLDRSSLHLRGWPRPHFDPVGADSLSLQPPTAGGVDAYLEDHPPSIFSYAFRYLIYGARVLPRKECERLLGRADHIPKTKELNRRILLALREDLEQRGLEHFAVLFHGERYVHETDWREHFLTTELDALGVPFVSSRRTLNAAREADGAGLAPYFYREGRGLNHYNPRGNQVVFETLRAGLRGAFDGAASSFSR